MNNTAVQMFNDDQLTQIEDTCSNEHLTRYVLSLACSNYQNNKILCTENEP